MSTIPVSHATESPGTIKLPWIVRCQKCGKEVARLDQAELTAMVMDQEVEQVFCFDCEIEQGVHDPSGGARLYPQEKLAPWPTISVPRSLLGFI